MNIQKGDTLKYELTQRPFRACGIVDHSTILPAECHIVNVRRVTKTKRGTKVHVEHGPHGFAALMVDQLSEFATISKVAA